jgi:hypothetical protein
MVLPEIMEWKNNGSDLKPMTGYFGKNQISFTYRTKIFLCDRPK